MNQEFKRRVSRVFPQFASALKDRPDFDLEHVEGPASPAELAALEKELAVPLPDDYKALLGCARQFWLLGGVVQFSKQHPFFHDFPSFEELTTPQQRVVRQKGGMWPPPSHGMLCFAEFFMEADGDQVLFDVSAGLNAGEYPIVYYAHDSRPPSIRQLAPTFRLFMESFLLYPQFKREHDEEEEHDDGGDEA